MSRNKFNHRPEKPRKSTYHQKPVLTAPSIVVNAGRNFPTLAGRIFPHPWEFWAFSPSLKTGTPF